MLRFLLKLAKLALKIFVPIFLVLILIGFIFVKYPKMTWNLAQKALLPENLTVDWEKIEFSGERKGWFYWAADIQVKKLSMKRASPEVLIVFNDARLGIALNIFEPKTQLVITNLVLQGAESGKLSFTLTPPEEAPERSPHQLIEDYIVYWESLKRRLDFLRADVHLSAIDLKLRNGDVYRFDFDVEKNRSEKESKNLMAKVSVSGPGLTGAAAATFIPENLRAQKSFFDISLDGRWNEWRLKGKMHAVYLVAGLNLSYVGDLFYKMTQGEVVLNTKAASLFHELGWDFDSSAKAQGLPGIFQHFQNINLAFDWPFTPGVKFAEEPLKFKISAAFGLNLLEGAKRTSFESACECKLPESIDVTAGGDLWPLPIFSVPAEKVLLAETSLQVQSLQNKLLTSNLSVTTDISKYGKDFVFEPTLNCGLQITSFKRLRDFLDANDVMVPAPFEILDGTVNFVAKNPVEINDSGYKTTVQLTSRLSSKDQQVDLTGQNFFTLKRDLSGLDLLMKIMIDNFKVALPPLDPILGLPPLKPDPRVQLEPAAQAKPGEQEPKKFAFRIDWAAETAKARGVKLLSPHANPNIPLTVEVKRAPQGDVAGSIQFEPTQIDYLKRRIYLDRLRITLNDQDEKLGFPIDGQIRIKQNQFLIFMDVTGHMRAPQIKLKSQPDLPRDEIVSILLFDRRKYQMEGQDSEAARNFDSALSDQAIGLLGLWMLASTPIRGFYYNPATKVYNASVNVSNTVTASFGTTWEDTAHLELRKRVSKNWMLAASWAPPREKGPKTSRLVLQWEKRF